MSEVTQEQIDETVRMSKIVEELQAVLTKHDVAAYIALASPKMGHYCYHLEAKWSAASIEDGQVKMRCRQEDGYTKEEVKERATDTVGMVMSLLNLVDNAQKNFLSLALTLGSKFDIFSAVKPMPEQEPEEPK
jgi:inhibitor of KinA sporulation pathway (predicted exonuclease)